MKSSLNSRIFYHQRHFNQLKINKIAANKILVDAIINHCHSSGHNSDEMKRSVSFSLQFNP